MKKTVSSFIAVKKITMALLMLLSCSTSILAQATGTKKAEKKFSENATTVEAFQQLLISDYTQVTTAYTAVSDATFNMNECMVMTSYGDEAINARCKEMQEKINVFFGKSTWAFSKYNQNTQNNVVVTTAAAQSGAGTYSGFVERRTISISGIFDGMTIEPYIYQNKANKKEFVLMFALESGMMCVMEFFKK